MMATVSDEYRAALAGGVPFPGRLGEPGEYARLATFLVEHDDNAVLTLIGITVRWSGWTVPFGWPRDDSRDRSKDVGDRPGRPAMSGCRRDL